MKNRTMKFTWLPNLSAFSWRVVRPGQGEQHHKSLRHEGAQIALPVCAGLKISAYHFSVLLRKPENFWRYLCMLLVLQCSSYSLMSASDDALEDGWTEGLPTNPVSLSPFIWNLWLCCSISSAPCEVEHHPSIARDYPRVLGRSFSLK